MGRANQKNIYNINFDITCYRPSNKKRDNLWSGFQQVDGVFRRGAS
jgi:hypothetical protein